MRRTAFGDVIGPCGDVNARTGDPAIAHPTYGAARVAECGADHTPRVPAAMETGATRREPYRQRVAARLARSMSQYRQGFGLKGL